MKKILTTAFMTFCVFFASAQSQTVQPKVDERTELLGIIFRIAGAKEYINNNIPSYAKEIDEYFAPFKGHDAIKFVQKVRAEQGVSYDAVMSLAIALEISDSVRLCKNLSPISIDDRWGMDNVNEFVTLLNKFYFETKFKEFFSDHSALYKIAESRFSGIISDVDFNWFEKFYGKKAKGNFNLILSIPNGGGNYGPKVILNDGTEDLYAIMGSCVADSSGQPSYSKRVAETVIHEYNHSFCNPLIEANFTAMEPASIKIFKPLKNKLSSQAYLAPMTMEYENLVRACVIRYYQRNGVDEDLLKRQVAGELAKGFIWIDKLVDLLGVYEKSRDKYPTLSDFMPEIIKLESSISPTKILKKIKANSPKIVSISIPDKSKEVDSNITEITLTFDRPMSFKNGVGYGKQGEKCFPEFSDKKSKWNEKTKKYWTFYIKLEPDKDYSMSFPSQFFYAVNYYPLDKTYYLDFKTRKQ
ncbi:MAG: DUF4932 domain-containing protein [Bacteroidales bacterium]